MHIAAKMGFTSFQSAVLSRNISAPPYKPYIRSGDYSYSYGTRGALGANVLWTNERSSTSVSRTGILSFRPGVFNAKNNDARGEGAVVRCETDRPSPLSPELLGWKTDGRKLKYRSSLFVLLGVVRLTTIPTSSVPRNPVDSS